MKVLGIDRKTRRFTEDYNNYYTLVFSAAYSRTCNIEESKDICQEVFIRYYEKIEDIITPRTWLQGAVRMVVLEHFRNRERDHGIVDESIEDAAASAKGNFQDSRILIQQALEELRKSCDVRDGALFELVAINNYTYKEAGRQLGMRERQARYRYRLVANRLTRYLEDRGIHSLEELL
ncbi:MAG: sigma-70 family RNA polymerase sigma factor [Spirochaetes bacterium]|nr:MAG: sigma-70 family RNA polymerase sigma factor [Spirochaetota bacterium]